MYDVTTRDIPARSVLCLKRNLAGQEGAWALGKEFVAVLQRRALPRMEGRAGAAFCIYSPADWQLVALSLHEWADQHAARPSELGARITYLAGGPVTDTSAPDCDFAIPIAEA